MQFSIESRVSIEYINPTVQHCIISISDSSAERASPAYNNLTSDILYMTFDDIDVAKQGLVLFNEDHADKILQFFQRYRDEVDLFIAHCNMGMSRSPGVIAALQRIQTGEDDIWFKTKTPNRLVYRTILERAYDTNLIT